MLFIVVALVSVVILGLIFSSMNKTIEKINSEADRSIGEPQTFFGQIKSFLNLIQLIAILCFYLAIAYIGYLVIRLIWF